MKTSKWTQSQINMLLEKAKDGNVRMHAFEEIAKLTGRQPNSVRNYYYKLIAGGNHSSHSKQKFSPFAAADTSHLLREIILGTSRGESVRAICLKQAKGDKGKMLRLQNKYRAVLAKSPQRITDIAKMLEEQGFMVKNPIKVRKLSKQKNMKKPSALQEKHENNVVYLPEYSNKRLSDADINNLFMGLVRLIKRSAGEEQTYNLKQQISFLKMEIERLKRNNGEIGNN